MAKVKVPIDPVVNDELQRAVEFIALSESITVLIQRLYLG
jgi:hypothetical protein